MPILTVLIVIGIFIYFLLIILHSTVNEMGSPWVIYFYALHKIFFIGLMMTVYGRNM